MKGKKGKLLLGLGALGALGMGTAAYAGQGDDTVSKSEVEQIAEEINVIPEEERNMFNQTVKKFQEFLEGIGNNEKKRRKTSRH